MKTGMGGHLLKLFNMFQFLLKSVKMTTYVKTFMRICMHLKSNLLSVRGNLCLQHNVYSAGFSQIIQVSWRLHKGEDLLC
jgi:hypothetical protein